MDHVIRGVEQTSGKNFTMLVVGLWDHGWSGETSTKQDFLVRELGQKFIFQEWRVLMTLSGTSDSLKTPVSRSLIFMDKWLQPPPSAKTGSVPFLFTMGRAIPGDLSSCPPSHPFRPHSNPPWYWWNLIRSLIFRFENIWLSHNNFDTDVKQFWGSLTVSNADLGGRLVLKLRALRAFLKS